MPRHAMPIGRHTPMHLLTDIHLYLRGKYAPYTAYKTVVPEKRRYRSTTGTSSRQASMAGYPSPLTLDWLI